MSSSVEKVVHNTIRTINPTVIGVNNNDKVACYIDKSDMFELIISLELHTGCVLNEADIDGDMTIAGVIDTLDSRVKTITNKENKA